MMQNFNFGSISSNKPKIIFAFHILLVPIPSSQHLTYLIPECLDKIVTFYNQMLVESYQQQKTCRAGQGKTHNPIQMIIVLYLLKRLDIKKLYFRVQVGPEIHGCFLVTHKKQHGTHFSFINICNRGFFGEDSFSESWKKVLLNSI